MNLCFKCQKPIEPEKPTHGLHLVCFQKWFGLPPHASTEFEDIALKREAHDSERQHPTLNTSFFHGKFKKYSATLQGRSYILKENGLYVFA
jgi:hypothetical protein